ncbi:MAG: thiamine pyrophosphate-binding protein [Planctomycetes bacterium]|nr:thiamine pyrophosphate-binding protein [Planctomycetota bacterium]
MKRNLSDCIFDLLASAGVEHIYGMTGGAIAFMLDRLAFRDDIRFICTAHEQAASMMAEACARVAPDSFGVAIGTSGPGAANLLTGIGCAWFDSVPCLFITGQVNTYESKGDRPVRQSGFQEMDIAAMAAPITKFSSRATTPEELLPMLREAISQMLTGRPGPVLLDIPMNLQRQEIEVTEADLDLQSLLKSIKDDRPKVVQKELDATVELLKRSRRPVLIVGGGVRRAGGDAPLLALAEKLGCPVCLSMNGIDCFPHDHPLFAGLLGVYGTRSANTVVANADLILAVGSRLDSRQTGVNTDIFGRAAKIIVVDIDPNECGYRLSTELKITADASIFLFSLLESMQESSVTPDKEWLAHIEMLRGKYLSQPESVAPDKLPSPYHVLDVLSGELKGDELVALDTGQNMVWAMQTMRVRGGMRMFTAGGMSPMGYSLPAAIGASLSKNGAPAIAVIGDGGMQINIQELETLHRLNLPVKIFILNNGALGLIRQFQGENMAGREIASSTKGGYSSPDFTAIAKAYGIPANSSQNGAEMKKAIREALATPGPFVCDIMIDEYSTVLPKIRVQHPPEDQYPYLPPEEIRANMLIDPIATSTYRWKD